MAEMQGVEIFATGVWNGTTIKAKHLNEMASNHQLFSRKLRVPLKFGHNDEQPFTDGQPALGWVSRLRVEGNKLLADFVDMPEKVFQVIKAGMFDRVSAEVLFGVENGEDNVGTVLVGVALLGADLPAVTDLEGLASLAASRIPGYQQQVFTLPVVNGAVVMPGDQLMFGGMADQGARAVDDGKVKSGGDDVLDTINAQQEKQMSDDIKALQARLDKMEKSNDDLKAENKELFSSNVTYAEKFEAQEAEGKRQEARATAELFTSKRDALLATLNASVEAGKLTPAIKSQIEVEIDTQRDDFSRNGKALLFSADALLAAADSAQLPSGEQAGGTAAGSSEKEGRKIEDASGELADAATAYSKEHKVDYATAEKAVMETDTVLAAAYASQQQYPEEA